MDGFVLELMRRRAVEGLVYLVGLKRGYVVGCVDWEDATRKPQIGAILWTRGTGSEEIVAAKDEQVNHGPPEFATLIFGKDKGKVPMHNLRMLLGKEKLQELREKCPSGIFDKELTVLRHRNVTVDLQLRLWKLQGYLAEYKEYIHADSQEMDMKIHGVLEQSKERSSRAHSGAYRGHRRGSHGEQETGEQEKDEIEEQRSF